MCYNDDGNPNPTVGFKFLHGGMIQADSITAINIAAGSITADKINVTDLAAISAAMGSLTSGSIILTLDTNKQMRLDNEGIYVTNDGGSIWKKVLWLNEAGEIVLSFDSYQSGDLIAGIGSAGSFGSFAAGTFNASNNTQRPTYKTVLGAEQTLGQVDQKFIDLDLQVKGPNGRTIYIIPLIQDEDLNIWEGSESSDVISVGDVFQDFNITVDELLADHGAVPGEKYKVGFKIAINDGSTHSYKDFANCTNFGKTAVIIKD